MRLANVQTFGSECAAPKQSIFGIWLRRSQIYPGTQIEKWSFFMCSCVISQRNHDFTERLRRLKILRWFCYACKGKPFTHRPMRSCVAAYFLKKPHPKGNRILILILNLWAPQTFAYCTFDLNWQPGPWKPRILLSP